MRNAKRVTWENRDDVKGQVDSSHRVNSQQRKYRLSTEEKQGQPQWRPKNTDANASTAVTEQLQEKNKTQQQQEPTNHATQSKKDDSGRTRTKGGEKRQRKNGTGESRTHGTTNPQSQVSE